MDGTGLQGLARRLHERAARRPVLAAGLAALAASVPGLDNAEGKKRKRKKPVCLNGKTKRVTRRKRKKLLKRGATRGACCVPTCNGTCGGSDGCGGVCGCSGNAVCNTGTCTPCTVTCSGSPIACGSALTQALLDGGPVFVCPGEYRGRFTAGKNTTLIGAGSGADPATNTILDGLGVSAAQSVLHVATSVALSATNLRLTGGENATGCGGLRAMAGSDVRLTNCVVAGNSGLVGGIDSSASLQLTDTAVTGNTGSANGGIRLTGAPNFVTRGRIMDNTSGLGAGGVFVGGGATIVGTEIGGNRANGSGGGVFVSSAALTLDSGTRITGNTASGGGVGGGIYRASGSVNLNGATVSGNSPDDCSGLTCPPPG